MATSPLPIAEWQESLSRIEATLADTVAALDGYEMRWANHNMEPKTAMTPVPGAAEQLIARLRDWDQRLAAAAELGQSVEQQLSQGEAAVSRWRERFEAWQVLIASPETAG